MAEISLIIIILFPILILFPLFGFFIKFQSISRKTHQKMYYSLTLLFAISFLNIMFMVISRFSPTLELAEKTYIVASIFDILSLFMLIIILQRFEDDKILSKPLIFFTIIVSMILALVLFSPELEHNLSEEGQYFISFKKDSIINILLGIFSLSATIWLIYIYKRNRKEVRNSQQKKLHNWLFAGIFLSQLVGSFIPILTEHLIQLLPENFVPQDYKGAMAFLGFIKTIGMIFVGIAFIQIGKKPWLVQRQKSHFILVYSYEGINLFSKIFRDDISESDMTLFTGAFSAVTMMFKETTKTSELIQSIEFEKKKLRIVAKENFLCALMVDYSTQSSESAHKQFAQEFEEKFDKFLIDFNGNVGQFRVAEEIASKYFIY